MGVLLTKVVRSRILMALLVTAAFGALLAVAADRGASPAPPTGPETDPVATVNGEPLPRAIFDRAFLKLAEHYVRFGPGLPLERIWPYRMEAFSQAVDEQLVADEARAHGITVSAQEVDAALDAAVNDYLAQLGGHHDDLETRLAQACAALGGPSHPTMSEPQFRTWLMDWLRPRHGEEARAALTAQRVKAELIPMPPVTEDDLRAQFATLTLRAIAIRYTSGDRFEDAAREAQERAEDLLRQIRAGADFAALAATASDDARYKATGGLEASVLLSSLNPDRQTAVATLQAGEVSELIRTDMGYEIIRVEERGYDLPADYEESKPELRSRLAEERQNQAWDQRVKAMHAAAAIAVTDSELLAYRRLEEGNAEEALALLEKASEEAESLGPLGATSVFFQLGARYSVQGRWEEATEAYATCDHYVSQVLTLFPGGRVSTLLGLGHTYENLAVQLRQQGQTARAEEASSQAVAHYQDVGRHTSNSSHHDRLRLAYERLGRPDLAEQEEAWIARYRSAMAERRKAIEEAREPASDGGESH